MFGEEPPGARSDAASCLRAWPSAGVALGSSLLSVMTCSPVIGTTRSMPDGVASCVSRAARLAPDGCPGQRVFQRPTCLSSLSLLKVPSPTMVDARRVAARRVRIIVASQRAIALRPAEFENQIHLDWGCINHARSSLIPDRFAEHLPQRIKERRLS